MKITEALFAEHLVFHHMFDYLEATLPMVRTLGELKALARLMETMLRDHSATEDDLFLGPLEHCFEQIGQREMFHREHEEIDANLKKVQESKNLARAREILLSAVSYSRRHFDKEERIVFPMAEKVLKPETLDELGEAWMAQRTQVAA
jgi:hemerythrin-like domain-containing protein